MAKVGLLSDTHGFLDEKVFSYFESCDQIWHAGDIGSTTIIEELANFKPFKAVYGNIDDQKVRNICPEDQRFVCEGLNVWITHIGGNPPLYNPGIKMSLAEKVPDIFVCGHSHILRVMHDSKHPPLLYLNPGAAGQHGFHKVRTLLRFDITAGKVSDMEAIELGIRG